MARTHKNAIRKTKSDLVFLFFNYLILSILFLIMVYPVYFVVVASVSDSVYVNSGDLLLWPKGFHLSGYEYVWGEQRIWIGYANTIFYAGVGALAGVTVSLMAGYGLFIKTLPGRGAIMGFMVFTMYFGGGLIPFYLLVKSLNLINTRTIIIMMSMVSVYNIILTRTFLNSTIPTDLMDAAFIDGCGYGRFFFKMVVPLSKAIIAVLSLYLIVGHWNSYFSPMLYLQDSDKKPLALFLREILLVNAETVTQQTENAEELEKYQRLLAIIKYAVIVVSTLPIMCIYPFLQKYFVQGVMIGSLKG